MSTYHSSGKTSVRGLKIALLVVIALITSVAVVLGLCLNKKTELAVAPESNVKTEQLDSSSLLSSNGWNNDVAMQLYQSLSVVGDNVALGNAGGVISSRVISLGGYSWSVVYKQNGIVTLYANEPVAYLNFDNASVAYANSAIREYLNGEFYESFVKKVGFSGFENMIAPYGTNKLYYQLDSAQAVPLQTVAGENIANCDGVANDMIWLPSAYEVGGFGVTKTSPKARVNSFKTINSNGLNVNSGLWNLSNDTRLKVDNAVLRSTAGNGVGVIKNGLITSGKVSDTYAIRPCLNIVMPNMASGVLMKASDTTYKNSVLLADKYPDLVNNLEPYADLSSDGLTLTAKTEGTVEVEGGEYTNAQMFLYRLAEIVNLSDNLEGYTFKLADNVDLSVFTVWNPIGNSTVEFAGVFDGQGYKISGLSSASAGNVGLFGNVSGSTAVVKNVAVVDSSWNTTRGCVGGITGLLSGGATIENCYSECGIAGGQFVGGIVGKSTGSSTIKNCYNKNGVAGSNYVGGIIGQNGDSTNGGSTISFCYNVGAVTCSGSFYGGVIGNNVAGEVSNLVYNNENISSGNTIEGVTGTAYAKMQGTKTLDKTIKPKSMENWTFDGSPWMISAVENDCLPMLKVFLKNITINVRSNDSLNQIAIGDGESGSTASVSMAVSDSTTVEIKARAVFKDSSHYQLKSWNLFKKSVGDTIVSTELTFADAGDATDSTDYKVFSLSVKADDSYNLEAVFEKLYALTVSPVFNGYNDTTAYDKTEFDYSINETAFAEKWYPAGTTLTMTIGSPKDRNWKFTAFTGSTDQSNWAAISVGDGSFITNADNKYSMTIGSGAPYSAGDVYYVRPVFDRYYNVTLSNVIPTPDNKDTRDIVTKMTISNPSAEILSIADSLEAEIKYDGKVTTSVETSEDTYKDVYKFVSWQLLNGSTAVASASTTSANLSIETQDNAVVNLVLRATFELQDITVSVQELLGATATSETSEAGVVVLSKVGNLTTISEDSKSLEVKYGTTVYAYILPTYASGYEFASFTAVDAPPTADTSGLVKTSFVATVSKTYSVVYAEIQNFKVTIVATLDDKDSTVFTFTPASYSGSVNTILTTVAETTNDEDKSKYTLVKVEASYNGKSGVIKTVAVSSTGYTALDSYSIFDGLTTKTIAGLLNQIGATAVYGNYDITVTANFISIIRTITVNETWNGVDSVGNTTKITHTSAYTIQDKTASKSGVVGQGTLKNMHTLTASPGAGYLVSSISKTSGNVSDFSGYTASAGTDND